MGHRPASRPRVVKVRVLEVASVVFRFEEVNAGTRRAMAKGRCATDAGGHLEDSVYACGHRPHAASPSWSSVREEMFSFEI